MTSLLRRAPRSAGAPPRLLTTLSKESVVMSFVRLILQKLAPDRRDGFEIDVKARHESYRLFCQNFHRFRRKFGRRFVLFVRGGEVIKEFGSRLNCLPGRGVKGVELRYVSHSFKFLPRAVNSDEPVLDKKRVRFLGRLVDRKRRQGLHLPHFVGRRIEDPFKDFFVEF